MITACGNCSSAVHVCGVVQESCTVDAAYCSYVHTLLAETNNVMGQQIELAWMNLWSLVRSCLSDSLLWEGQQTSSVLSPSTWQITTRLWCSVTDACSRSVPVNSSWLNAEKIVTIRMVWLCLPPICSNCVPKYAMMYCVNLGFHQSQPCNCLRTSSDNASYS